MKKIICLLICFALMVTAIIPVMADESRVEIKFCVGDDTLMINGNSVTVEKPYVAGEGVTLVPLRVITEAFGAEVNWIDETQTIEITYPDVKIVLQIDNPIADVNGKMETLLYPPELKNDFTMVPLRFISENFGADVSYDDETEMITVVKENKASTAQTVVGNIDSKTIGDSYYGWSIENSSEFPIKDNSFDGRNTIFEHNERNGFYIDVKSVEDDYDFERNFSSNKSGLQGMTLVKAEKDTSDPARLKQHFQAKDKDNFVNIIIYVTDKYAFCASGVFDNTTPEIKDEGVRTMSTFVPEFVRGAYDISNVKNGVRRFESKEMKLSFNVPQNFVMVSDESAIDDFEFRAMSDDDKESYIHIQICSKDSETSAEKLAHKDHDNNKRNLNEDIVQFSEVMEHQYNDFFAYEYTQNINARYSSSSSRDVFFEVGDYIYNICVDVKKPFKGSVDEFIDSIVNSVKAEKLNPAEVGTILRNISENEGITYESKIVPKCTLTVPSDFTEINTGEILGFYNIKKGVAVEATTNVDKALTSEALKKEVKYFEESQCRTQGVESIKQTQYEMINDKSFITFTLKNYDMKNKKCSYIECFFILHGGVVYMFSASYDELGYSQGAREQVRSLVGSISFK